MPMRITWWGSSTANPRVTQLTLRNRCPVTPLFRLPPFDGRVGETRPSGLICFVLLHLVPALQIATDALLSALRTPCRTKL